MPSTVSSTQIYLAHVHLSIIILSDIGVILAGVIMLKSTSPARFYADPAMSLLISFIIFASAIPLGEFTRIPNL